MGACSSSSSSHQYSLFDSISSDINPRGPEDWVAFPTIAGGGKVNKSASLHSKLLW